MLSFGSPKPFLRASSVAACVKSASIEIEALVVANPPSKSVYIFDVDGFVRLCEYF